MELTASTDSADPQSAQTRYRLEFDGTASEYFRIWIVNISLTIVTLGIYSAWAKVRKLQYFYGNSRLAGGTFEFTADPVSILKGRLLVFFLFLSYQLAATFQPVLAIVLALVFIPVLPWVIIKALSFNLRYSSYRGLHFRFDARYWEAFKVYVLLTVAIPLTLGLAYPYAAWRRKQFFVDNSRYGTSLFGFDGSLGHFYTVYVVGWLAMTGIGLAAFLLVTAGTVVAGLSGIDIKDYLDIDVEGKEELFAAIFVVIGLAFYALFFLLFVVVNTGIQALIANHVWQHTSIADAASFDLDLNMWKVVGIQATNILAIIFTLGLLIPWASIRMMRYRASRFSMIAAPAHLESFIASERKTESATGTELGDALDLDLGL